MHSQQIGGLTNCMKYPSIAGLFLFDKIGLNGLGTLKKLGLFLFQTVYSGHLKTFRTDICLRSTQSDKTYLGLHSMKQQSIATLPWMEC